MHFTSENINDIFEKMILIERGNSKLKNPIGYNKDLLIDVRILGNYGILYVNHKYKKLQNFVNKLHKKFENLEGQEWLYEIPIKKFCPFAYAHCSFSSASEKINTTIEIRDDRSIVLERNIGTLLVFMWKIINLDNLYNQILCDDLYPLLKKKCTIVVGENHIKKPVELNNILQLTHSVNIMPCKENIFYSHKTGFRCNLSKIFINTPLEYDNYYKVSEDDFSADKCVECCEKIFRYCFVKEHPLCEQCFYLKRVRTTDIYTRYLVRRPIDLFDKMYHLRLSTVMKMLLETLILNENYKVKKCTIGDKEFTIIFHKEYCLIGTDSISEIMSIGDFTDKNVITVKII